MTSVSISPRRPATAALSAATPRVQPPSATAGGKYDGELPPGWSQRESRTHPGLWYFITPDGPTWNRPTAQQCSPSPRRREPKQSIYQHDFLRWTNARDFNPDELEDGGKRNASYSLHPKAAVKPDSFLTINRQDFVAFPAVPAAPRNPFPSHQVTPFQNNSTYRSDFTNSGAAQRPESRRRRTPPRQSHFEHTSTHRADFVDFHPSRPKIVRPVPQLHFKEGGPIQSTYRQDYTPQRRGDSSHSPRFRRDPGWSGGLNKGDEDTYRTLYNTDYVGADAAVLNRSATIDRSIVSRCQAHEELHDVE